VGSKKEGRKGDLKVNEIRKGGARLCFLACAMTSAPFVGLSRVLQFVAHLRNSAAVLYATHSSPPTIRIHSHCKDGDPSVLCTPTPGASMSLAAVNVTLRCESCKLIRARKNSGVPT